MNSLMGKYEVEKVSLLLFQEIEKNEKYGDSCPTETIWHTFDTNMKILS